MKILSFRVQNFRSVVDSGWIKLSTDGITVLVGQNESGKSSLLSALSFASSSLSPTDDDFRAGAPSPCISLRAELRYAEIEERFTEYTWLEREIVESFLMDRDSVELDITWTYKNNSNQLSREVTINSVDIYESLNRITSANTVGELSPSEFPTGVLSRFLSSNEEELSRKATLTPDEFATIIWEELPYGVLFNEEDGELPNTIDINGNGDLVGPGKGAAENYLKIAGIDLQKLISQDRRTREHSLNRANKKVSEDFNNFWTQTIGNGGKLHLKCEIDHYDISNTSKVGVPHLVFWISDGHSQLYPKQRSQGVRWFVSFYLQLKATELAKVERIFLLDEPGANLHSRAQADVLRLINNLGKQNASVIYTTHSPQLLEYSKLFRVHAVQRDSDRDDSPTIVIDAHRLGTASTDTLSPVLSAMGADLSQHQVIRRTNNVLLEEMSGHYYLKAFWILSNEKKEAYFIAATGVNKIEPLANMFRGWGLDFIVAIDDDRQGREAFKSMMQELFGNDEVAGRRKLLKIPDCPSIEDVFSQSDFCKFVLNEVDTTFDVSNGEFLKSSKISKPVIAYHFLNKVEKGEITMDMLDEITNRKIRKIVSEISDRLE